MWSEIEIVKNYREAKHKKSQIKILSELNACSQEQIISILLRNGYEQTTKFDYPTPIKTVEKKVETEVKEEKPYGDIKPLGKETFEGSSTKKAKKTVVKRKRFKRVITEKDNDKSNSEVTSSEERKSVKTVETPISMLISDDELIERFVIKRQTIAHIAETFGIEKHRLQKYMENHDIVRERKNAKSVSSNVVAEAMVADKLLDAKIKTYLDAAQRLREKADEFEAQAEALKTARDAINGDIGEDLGNVMNSILKGASL